MNPRYVTPPEQLERALRDLITGWQEVVFAEPTATDDYREKTQQAALDVEASFKGGATAYQAVIFALAPLFAAADEETVEVVVRPDDAEEVAAVRRGGVAANALVHIEIGDTPGDLPETPPEHREAARQTLELLLGGWADAVGKADVSDRYRRVVAETTQRVREAAEHGTTPHNLVSTLLAVAFLLPDEPEPASITTADLETLGAVLHRGDHAERLYPSVFDDLEAPERPHRSANAPNAGRERVSSVP